MVLRVRGSIDVRIIPEDTGEFVAVVDTNTNSI